MVMMLGSWRIAVTPELLITGDLLRVEKRARFEMRRQMHRAQAASQSGNCRRRGGEAIRRDLVSGKELVEGLFLRDQFTTDGLAAALMRSKMARTSRCCVSVSPSCAASTSTCTGPG